MSTTCKGRQLNIIQRMKREAIYIITNLGDGCQFDFKLSASLFRVNAAPFYSMYGFKVLGGMDSQIQQLELYRLKPLNKNEFN